MSPNLLMLFAGLAVVWLVLFAYLYYLSRQVQAARLDLEELRELAGSASPPGRVVGATRRVAPTGAGEPIEQE